MGHCVHRNPHVASNDLLQIVTVCDGAVQQKVRGSLALSGVCLVVLWGVMKLPDPAPLPGEAGAWVWLRGYPGGDGLVRGEWSVGGIPLEEERESSHFFFSLLPLKDPILGGHTFHLWPLLGQ